MSSTETSTPSLRILTGLAGLVKTVSFLLSKWRARWFGRRPGVRQQPLVGATSYPERISVATWVLVFGFGLSLLLRIPTVEIRFWAFGSPTQVEVTATTLMAALLAVAAAAGAESILHPRLRARRQRLAWAYWALPAAISIITIVLLPAVPTRLLQVAVILSAGLFLILAFYSLYATVEPGQPGFRRARFWLDLLSYGVALLLFLFVYQSRTRSLLSGTLIALTATPSWSAQMFL